MVLRCVLQQIEGVIVEQIRNLMRLLQILSILYVSRVANMTAHSIANFVVRIDGHFQYFEVGSSWLMKIVFNDQRTCNQWCF